MKGELKRRVQETSRSAYRDGDRDEDVERSYEQFDMRMLRGLGVVGHESKGEGMGEMVKSRR